MYILHTLIYIPTYTHKNAYLPVYILACIQKNICSYVSTNVRAHTRTSTQTHTKVHLLESVIAM